MSRVGKLPDYNDEFSITLVRLRRQLRKNWSDDKLSNWYTQVVVLVAQDQRFGPFCDRLHQIMNSNVPLGLKVETARDLLNRILEAVASLPGDPVIGPSVFSPNTPINLNINIPNTLSQIQDQSVLLPIQPDWDAVERSIETDTELSEEQKEEAKSHARTIWEGVVNRTQDLTTFAGAISSLGKITGRADDILKLFNVGQ